MKALSAVLFCLLFSLPGFGQIEIVPSDRKVEDVLVYNDTLDFKKGEAASAVDYYFGVLVLMHGIDAKLEQIKVLDSKNAKPRKIAIVCDTLLVMIKGCRTAMQLYEGKGWNKQNELQALTLEWLGAAEVLVNDLLGLAEAFSIRDKKWTDAQLQLYDHYIADLEEYLKLYYRWVAFQYEFAQANGFKLASEPNSLLDDN